MKGSPNRSSGSRVSPLFFLAQGVCGGNEAIPKNVIDVAANRHGTQLKSLLDCSGTREFRAGKNRPTKHGRNSGTKILS
jgi:hypothetical protein